MSKVDDGGPATVRGYCNKCGYVGECEVDARGSLIHYRRDGKQCHYTAARMPLSAIENDARTERTDR